MTIIALILISYFQIGHILTVIHSQQRQTFSPLHTKHLSNYLVRLFAWPLVKRPNKLLWFITSLILNTVFNYILFNFIKTLIEPLYSILIIIAFTFTPIVYFYLTLLFLLLRLISSLLKFRIYFLKSLKQKFLNRKKFNAFILSKDPLIQDNALQPNLMNLHPESRKRKKLHVWIAQMNFFVDSITWMSAFHRTLAGESKDLHPSNTINEETATDYAQQMTTLSRE